MNLPSHPSRDPLIAKPNSLEYQETSFVFSFKEISNVVKFFMSCFPVALLGLLIGSSASWLFTKTTSARLFMATALFEMMPTPLKTVVDSPDGGTISDRAENREKIDRLEKLQSGELIGRRAIDRQPQNQQEEAVVTTYQKIIMSPEVKKTARQKLLAKGIQEMGNFHDTQIIGRTNLLEIRAVHTDRVIASETASAWAHSVIDLLTRLNAEHSGNIASFFHRQYLKNQQTIDDLTGKIITLRNQSRFDIKEAELATKKDLLVNALKDLEMAKSSIRATEITLPALSRIANREIENETALQSFLNGEGKARMNQKLFKKLENDPRDIDGIAKQLSGIRTITQTVSPIYGHTEAQQKEMSANLETLYAKKRHLQESNEQLSRETVLLGQDISQTRLILSNLEKNLEIAKRQNDLIYGKLAESSLSNSLNFAGLRLVSDSDVPDSPMPVDTKKATAWGAMVGLLIGFLLTVYLPGLRVQKNFQKSPLLPVIPTTHSPEHQEILN